MLYSLFPSSFLYTCPLFYFLGQLTAHTSAFYNVILTVVRTLTIIRPYYKVKRRLVTAANGAVAVCWGLVVLYEICFIYNMNKGSPSHLILIKDFIVFPKPGGTIIYSVFCKSGWLDCSKDVFDYGKVILWTCVILPYALPSLTCGLSALYQIYYIVNKRNAREHSARINRRLTVTIVILTLFFVVFNTTYFIVVGGGFDVPYETPTLALIITVSSNYLLFANSLATPAILIWRGTTLNEYARSRVSVAKRHVYSSIQKIVHEPTNNTIV